MKNLKLKMSVAALVLGLGSAMATTHSNSTNRKWGRDALGVYTEVTGMNAPADYKCKSSSSTCTEEYPADVDPNDQAGDAHAGTALPTNIVLGDFSI